MTYITGHDRSQLLLLPEAVDDYVGADNPVRFIDTFVDGLDLAAAGFGRAGDDSRTSFGLVRNWLRRIGLVSGRRPYWGSPHH
jgi:hypothetical protein